MINISTQINEALQDIIPSKPKLKVEKLSNEILRGSIINLSDWSNQVNDNHLLYIASHCNDNNQISINISPVETLRPDELRGNFVLSVMFENFFKKSYSIQGIIHLNLKGCKFITDNGLISVLRISSELVYLNICHCTQISDQSMKILGKYCQKLRYLNISYCPSINGDGLAAISDECRDLKEFYMSHNNSIQSWALIRIFSYCLKLEIVDISFTNVTDEEIFFLCKNCIHLVRIIASNSSYISDASLQELSKYCKDLEFIDFGRKNFPERINDISLWSLSQQLTNLTILKLNGCSFITDTGLLWLSEGCKILEEIDISCCPKITDAALRAIGYNCHMLLSLNISHLKNITDLGIKYLSVACRKLQNIQLKHLHRLTDHTVPRDSHNKITLKSKANTLLGIDALASTCHSIKFLDLSNCLNINDSITRNMANKSSIGLSLLKVNFSGCTSISSESMLIFVSSLSQLVEFDGSDCVKCMNNKVLSVLTSNCSHTLRKLVLIRCVNIRSSSLRSIALNCHVLEYLDVTGCKALDDISLIPICDHNNLKFLKFLILVGNPLITDTTISWIVNRFISMKSIKSRIIMQDEYIDNTFHLLALKGTSVSSSCLQAFQDSFPCCDYINNDSFFGYYMKTNINCLLMISKYTHFHNCLISIQRLWRMKYANIIVRRLKKVKYEILLISKIQSYCRMFLQRKVFKEQLRLYHSSILISQLFLKQQEQLKQLQLESQIKDKKRWICALLIQCHYRRYFIQKNIYKKLLNEYNLHQRIKIYYATKIQSILRMSRQRKKYIRDLFLNNAYNERLVRYRVIIQCHYRGYLARRNYQKIVSQYHSHQIVYMNAIHIIQKKIRQWILVNHLKTLITIRRMKLLKAIQLQRWIRMKLAICLRRRLELYKRNQILNEYVRIIQKQIQVKLFRIYLNKRISKRLHKLRIRNDAWRVLQGFAKIISSKKLLQQRRQEYMKEMEMLVYKEIHSIIKIQSWYRGVLGRRIFMILLNQKRGRWKELFDEVKQIRYFYNQQTGEIRYRMPQDLLDMLPCPKCDNCSNEYATLECKDCNEMFCGICFDNVHNGGRRRGHEFRALYDYYHKRIDYGDYQSSDMNNINTSSQLNNEYPCTWPSEVIQDELQGWMLRIAPVREPIAVYGAWEVYHDSTTLSNDVNDKHVFYFNRQTYETTYDKPDEVVLMEQSTLEFSQTHSFGYYDKRGDWIHPQKESNVYDTEPNVLSIEASSENVFDYNYDIQDDRFQTKSMYSRGTTPFDATRVKSASFSNNNSRATTPWFTSISYSNVKDASSRQSHRSLTSRGFLSTASSILSGRSSSSLLPPINTSSYHSNSPYVSSASIAEVRGKNLRKTSQSHYNLRFHRDVSSTQQRNQTSIQRGLFSYNADRTTA